MSLTQARLKEVLIYLPTTGEFISKRNHGPVKVGDAVGHADSDGYLVIGIDSRIYKSHRLAYLDMTGSWPSDQVDHINGVRNDNRWENLRESTQLLNKQNKVRKAHLRPNGKWQAKISVAGKDIHIGYFETEEEAQAAILAAKAIHHPSFESSRHVTARKSHVDHALC